MNPPRLAPLSSLVDIADLPVAALPLFAPGEGPAFVVIESGRFLGRDYARGDVLVLGEAQHPEDPVVLAPRGRGAPRMGLVTPRGLLGDRGEPCSVDRFLVAGALTRVIRARVQRAPVQAPAVRELRPAASVEARDQLALFARVA